MRHQTSNIELIDFKFLQSLLVLELSKSLVPLLESKVYREVFYSIFSSLRISCLGNKALSMMIEIGDIIIFEFIGLFSVEKHQIILLELW